MHYIGFMSFNALNMTQLKNMLSQKTKSDVTVKVYITSLDEVSSHLQGNLDQNYGTFIRKM